MKKNITNYIYIVITCLVTYLLFKYNNVFKLTILKSCDLFLKNIIPSILPMIIITDILNNYNFIKIVIIIFRKFFKNIFRMSDASIYAFVMSIITGTPTNAYIVSNLVNMKYINNNEAAQILSYATFLNPLFLYNMLNSIFIDKTIVFKILLIYYLSNFIILFFNRNQISNCNDLNININKNTFTKVLSDSIKRATPILINILGTIIFYLVISEAINLFIRNELASTFISGLLEVSGGLFKLSSLNISILLKEYIAIIFISFGGFSIQAQIKNIIIENNISSKPFFKGRIIQIAIGIILLYLINLI